MSSQKYKCYSCYGVFEYKDLCAECMCIHPNDTTAKYRGVCKNCKEVTKDKWVEVPDGNHQLNMIRELTNEANSSTTDAVRTFMTFDRSEFVSTVENGWVP